VGSFLVGRLLQSTVTAWAFVTLLFFMFRLIPGNPMAMYVDQALPPETQRALVERFGLDRSLGAQYVRYLVNLSQGDFGTSFTFRRPVLEVLGEKIAHTLVLVTPAIGAAFVGGAFLGGILGWLRGRLGERVAIVLILFFKALPSFWLGTLLLMLFTFRLGWLPLGGIRSIGTPPLPLWQTYLSPDFLWHLVLPALTATLEFVGLPLLMMRNSIIEVMRSDYIAYARAKGLSESRLLWRHAGRNALLPVVTLFASLSGFAIGGLVVIEMLFRWPGMGRELVEAIGRRDYPVIQTAFFFMGILVIVVNILTDVVYTYLDPRVRLDARLG
jgi:peptide/nickel transport system permease protein